MTTLCSDWLTGEDVATCCDVESSDSTIFDEAAVAAQEILFEFSARRFPGECEQTVRPCRTNCGCGWVQILSRGHIVWNENFENGSWLCDDNPCGCRGLSQVPLSGIVREIVEVVIDGDVVDPATYRVDRHHWLVRQRASATDTTTPVWPGCQVMDLPPGEPGTWTITYTYGMDPPAAGVRAAIELACEIYKSCAGQPCALPKGVVRLARQGVTLEKTPFVSWGFETGKGGRLNKGWSTGMAAVDAFLNAYNPGGLIRVPVIWSPSSQHRFPVPVTQIGT